MNKKFYFLWYLLPSWIGGLYPTRGKRGRWTGWEIEIHHQGTIDVRVCNSSGVVSITELIGGLSIPCDQQGLRSAPERQTHENIPFACQPSQENYSLPARSLLKENSRSFQIINSNKCTVMEYFIGLLVRIITSQFNIQICHRYFMRRGVPENSSLVLAWTSFPLPWSSCMIDILDRFLAAIVLINGKEQHPPTLRKSRCHPYCIPLYQLLCYYGPAYTTLWAISCIRSSDESKRSVIT